MRLATSWTVRTSEAEGPKFQAPPNVEADSRRFAARSKYPDSGSSTCCQGRVDSGCRSSIAPFAAAARTQSGTIRSRDQSPPPITLPARADAAPQSSIEEKYELTYAANTI